MVTMQSILAKHKYLVCRICREYRIVILISTHLVRLTECLFGQHIPLPSIIPTPSLTITVDSALDASRDALKCTHPWRREACKVHVKQQSGTSDSDVTSDDGLTSSTPAGREYNWIPRKRVRVASAVGKSVKGVQHSTRRQKAPMKYAESGISGLSSEQEEKDKEDDEDMDIMSGSLSQAVNWVPRGMERQEVGNAESSKEAITSDEEEEVDTCS